MKRVILSIVAVVAIALSTKAMSFQEARHYALFLTDKMAYEMRLSDEQYDALYEINLDYLMSLKSRSDIRGSYWKRRNADINIILGASQYARYRSISDFYLPVSWGSNVFTLQIYSRYPNHNVYYRSRPSVYGHFRGGHRHDSYRNLYYKNTSPRSWDRGYRDYRAKELYRESQREYARNQRAREKRDKEIRKAYEKYNRDVRKESRHQRHSGSWGKHGRHRDHDDD